MPALTIENAPTYMIKSGSLSRKLKSGWDGPGHLKRVVSLNPTDFDAVFANGYGDDWTFRFKAGKGEWTSPDESGEILDLQQDGSRGSWSGHMYDQTKGKEAIFFRMTFEIR